MGQQSFHLGLLWSVVVVSLGPRPFETRWWGHFIFSVNHCFLSKVVAVFEIPVQGHHIGGIVTPVWEGLPATPHLACFGQESDAHPPLFIHFQMLFPVQLGSVPLSRRILTFVQGLLLTDLGHIELGVASTLLPWVRGFLGRTKHPDCVTYPAPW